MLGSSLTGLVQTVPTIAGIPGSTLFNTNNDQALVASSDVFLQNSLAMGDPTVMALQQEANRRALGGSVSLLSSDTLIPTQSEQFISSIVPTQPSASILSFPALLSTTQTVEPNNATAQTQVSVRQDDDRVRLQLEERDDDDGDDERDDDDFDFPGNGNAFGLRRQMEGGRFNGNAFDNRDREDEDRGDRSSGPGRIDDDNRGSGGRGDNDGPGRGRGRGQGRGGNDD